MPFLGNIIFSENEQLPRHVEAGDVIPLRFMPTVLLLRAADVQWILPTSQMAGNPALSGTSLRWRCGFFSFSSQGPQIGNSGS